MPHSRNEMVAVEIPIGREQIQMHLFQMTVEKEVEMLLLEICR